MCLKRVCKSAQSHAKHLAVEAPDWKGQVGAQCQCSRAKQEWTNSRYEDQSKAPAMLQGNVASCYEKKNAMDK